MGRSALLTVRVCMFMVDPHCSLGAEDCMMLGWNVVPVFDGTLGVCNVFSGQAIL